MKFKIIFNQNILKKLKITFSFKLNSLILLLFYYIIFNKKVNKSLYLYNSFKI